MTSGPLWQFTAASQGRTGRPSKENYITKDPDGYTSRIGC